MAAIRRRFEGRGFSEAALTALCEPLLRRSMTNRVYLGGQRRCIWWASHTGVDVNHFTVEDLINFLSSAHQQGYSFNTIKLFRTGVLILHVDPQPIRHAPEVHQLLARFTKDAPLRPMTQSHFDLTPILHHLARFASSTLTPLTRLNEKVAFLLAAAAFLRPSDLHRIQLTRCQIDSDRRLHLYILAPKETRGGRRIVKQLLIQPLPVDSTLCPVSAFEALRDHPAAASRPSDSLFVNSIRPSSPVHVSTISGWLRRLLSRSSALSPTAIESSLPSLRSVASNLALVNGASLEEVLVMGNWSSSTVFDNHYRRSIQFGDNISRRVLTDSLAPSSSS